jgi:hypothetical protein
MKPLERLTHCVSFRTGIMESGAMTCLARSSTPGAAENLEQQEDGNSNAS